MCHTWSIWSSHWRNFPCISKSQKVSRNVRKCVCVGRNMSKFLVVQDTMNVSVTNLPGDKNSTRHICHTVTCDGSYWPRCLQRSLDWEVRLGGRSIFLFPFGVFWKVFAICSWNWKGRFESFKHNPQSLS